MSADMWSEFGFDWDKFDRWISRKNNVATLINNKLKEDCYQFLKQKYNLPENIKREGVKNLLATNPDVLKEIFFLSIQEEKFSSDKIQHFYSKKFGNSAGKTVQLMLIQAYLEDQEILRQYHYSTLFSHIKLFSAIPSGDFDGFDLQSIDEGMAEEIVKSYFVSPQNKSKVSVWYVLKEPGYATVFLFKGAKVRAKIPSLRKRHHEFIGYSKLIVLHFSQDGRILEVHSRPTKEFGLKIGSSIASKLKSTPQNQVEVRYVQKEVRTNKTSVIALIEQCANANPECKFELYELSCRPKVHFNDCHLVFKRNRDRLTSMIKEIEKALDTAINADKINEIKVMFNNKKFLVNFTPLDNENCVVTYSSIGNAITDREFEKEMLRSYGITLLRNAR